MNDYQKYLAKVHHLNFMQATWRKKADPLLVGLHTRSICDLIDRAINDFDEGRSSFIIITVPPRHGKSDIISKYAPAHFIANHPDKDVMVCSYNASLAIGHSKFSRDLLDTDEFKELYPNVKLSSKNSASDSWGVEGGVGVVTASGLTSGITGKGYHLGILDDYCAGRNEAESVAYRETAWECFTNDFLTRQAPTCITIILATPWHVDDIIGRIKSKNNPEDKEHYDPAFRKYEVVKFPAQNGTATVVNNKGEEEVVEYDYLFTEHTLSTGEKIAGRFSPEYYESAYASLGDYSYQALYQCDPTIRGGNLLRVDRIKLHNDLSDFPNTKYYRIWDLAHTEKQLNNSDPDWTAGTLLTYTKVGDVWHLWVKNVQRIRANAPERDNFIRATTEKDGANVTVAVENSIESKDALTTMQSILRGRRIVRGIQCKGDKIARMGFVEPIFEAGNVHVYNDNWTLDWINEAKSFPSGKHDDQMDNLSAGYELICANEQHVVMGAVIGI